jgi:hypothetical protein
MPRKKLIRRFEPRYSVSQEMVDREAQYVAREHADYLLGSTRDLQDQLDKWRPLWQQVNETAESLIQHQGEREALAYRCMITRDLYHILELYCTCMRSTQSETVTQAPSTLPRRSKKPVEEQTKVSAFTEWLFGEEG